MKKVLLVEDSPALADVFRIMLESDATIEVVGVARSGQEAFDLTEKLHPDLITVDLRMPAEEVLTGIRRIMSKVPTPVVVVTDLGSDPDGRHLVLDAMTAGALTVIEKPDPSAGGKLRDVTSSLISQVKLMSQVRPSRAGRGSGEEAEGSSKGSGQSEVRVIRVVGIAASTGGPQALCQILSELPADFPCPILLVQHICKGFLKDFANWLDSKSCLRIILAPAGELTAPGTVYVAPEDVHLGLFPDRMVRLSASAPVGSHRPSATFLFSSLAQVAPRESLGILLTGMGEDGVEGLLELKEGGGLTFVQDRRSSVVFGMPQVAIERGAADRVIGLEHMAACILEAVRHDGKNDPGHRG